MHAQAESAVLHALSVPHSVIQSVSQSACVIIILIILQRRSKARFHPEAKSYKEILHYAISKLYTRVRIHNTLYSS
jgi:hypothetical protein